MTKGTSALRVDGKTAVITGAASGIGKATAWKLANAGAKVALTDLNDDELKQAYVAINSSGAQTLACKLDVTSESEWEETMNLILSEWGHLDIAVNCAGISFARAITETSLTDWRRVMATNLDGVFLGTRQAMKAMQERGGCIINIGSAAGTKPLARNAPYGTSKAALRFFTRIAALEGSSQNIRVNSISPGAVATTLWEGTEMWPKDVADVAGREAALKVLVAERGFAEPEQIASAVLFLASDEARHITGADLPIDDGFAIT